MLKKYFQLLMALGLIFICKQVFAITDHIVERAYFEDVTAQMSFEEARH
jgi:hypothetical protein